MTFHWQIISESSGPGFPGLQPMGQCSIGYCSRAAPNKPDTFEDGKLGIVTRDDFKDNQNAVTPKRVTKRGSKIPKRNGGL